MKHGRYSTIMHAGLRDLIERYEADPDPLNILPELAFARALLQNFCGAGFEATQLMTVTPDQLADAGRPRQVLDISSAHQIVAEITRIVERIERIRAANAISQPELFRMMAEMARVVERHVPDPAVLGRIRDGWLGLRLA